jgi:hypothetical protein
LEFWIGGIVVTKDGTEFVLNLMKTALRVRTIELKGKAHSSLEALVEAIRREVHVTPEELVGLLKQTRDALSGDFLISELADLVIGELKPASDCVARGIKSLLIASQLSRHAISGYLGPFNSEFLIDYLYTGTRYKQSFFSRELFGLKSRNDKLYRFLRDKWET